MKKNKNINKDTKINSKKRGNDSIGIDILLLISLIIIFIFIMNNVNHIQDDAFISFRYIKNFIEGHGLVFNIGERVEGYTNFLWTMILIVPALLKINIVSFSEILSSFFGIATLCITFLISKLINQKYQDKNYPNKSSILLNFVPVFLLTFTGAFSYWASSGMETSFFIFLVLTGIYFYIKNNNANNLNFYTPVFIALSALTRPEGILFFLIIYIHKVLFIAIEQRKIKSPRKIFSQKYLVEVSIFIIPVIVQTIFRLLYYGYPFPNTYYAKVTYGFSTFGRGIEYLLSFNQDYLLYGIIFVLPIILLIKRKFDFVTSLFYLIIFIYSLYVVIIGGDVLSLHRFWLVILPLIYILWGMFLKEVIILSNEKKLLPANSATMILLTISIAIGAYNYLHCKDKISGIRDNEIALVNQFKMQASVINRLEQIRNRRLTIAVSTIGSLSYYTDATVIDMLGLTDAYVAHNPEFIPEISNDHSISWKEKKYNSSYIISRKPDYILFSTGSKPSAYAERALFTNNKFFYFYYIQFIPRPSAIHLYYYSRKTKEQLKLTNPDILSAKINHGWVDDYVNLFQSLHIYQRSKTLADLNSVINDFNQSVKSAPSFFADDYRILGDAYFIAGDITEAQKIYNKALAIDSLNVLSYLGLGRIYQNKNETKAADFYAKEMQIKGLVVNEFIYR